MAKDPTELSWYRKCARKMVREGKAFLHVTDELGLNGIDGPTAKQIQESETFQAVLRQERLKLAKEYADDPELSKNVAIGMMLMAIEKLMMEAQWDKALEGLKKLATLAGWQGTEGNVNVYQGLNQRDFDELKKRIQDGPGRKAATEAVN